EFYDRQNALHRVLTCSGFSKVSGFWTTGKMLMKNVQTEHYTTIEMTEISYNTAMDDSMFTVSALENGRIR
ncbi:MAG: outer membrane lipoprotein-sorting protein, partial [Treponemataceae bacterium]|nr:outer membrane lipoprotein-sorting protein [Treponemataceae bacterium]